MKPLMDLGDLAVPGAVISVRVTPRARANRLRREGELLRVDVTASPEDGRANAEVQAILARALGIAKTRLTLLRGATSRDKQFRIDD